MTTLKMVHQFSHEIDNQLTIIVGRSDLMLTGGLSEPEIRHHVHGIRAAALRIAEFVRKLMHVSAP